MNGGPAVSRFDVRNTTFVFFLNKGDRAIVI